MFFVKEVNRESPSFGWRPRSQMSTINPLMPLPPMKLPWLRYYTPTRSIRTTCLSTMLQRHSNVSWDTTHLPGPSEQDAPPPRGSGTAASVEMDPAPWWTWSRGTLGVVFLLGVHNKVKKFHGLGLKFPKKHNCHICDLHLKLLEKKLYKTQWDDQSLYI